MSNDGRNYLPGTRIEIVRPEVVRGRIRHALFDFDGTLSLIREGWQDVMVPMMAGVLQATPKAEDETAIRQVVRDFVTELTGKQTIYQMIRLAEEVKRRGGEPEDPLAYKHRYLDLLWARIHGRVDDLESGRAMPEDMVVPGSYDLLRNLKSRGTKMFLASGTDHSYMLREAQLLRLPEFFGDSIHGALDDYKSFSKKMVIDRILEENRLSGPELLAIGDGYVEIEDTVGVGGVAVGVASDEARRSVLDEWKRQRLIDAGAHIIVSDYREQGPLLAYLFERS